MKRSKTTTPTGRAWAFAGFFLGTAVSVAGNVAHTWHPSDEQLAVAGLSRATAEQWQPELGAQLFAAFFPLALLLTVEVLSRAAWPSGWAWSMARYGGTSLVALVAAVVSYMHLHDLLRAYGEDRLTAVIGPLAVDGLMVVCGFAILAISRTKTAETVVQEPAPVVEPAPLEVEQPEEISQEISHPAEKETAAQPPVADRDSAIVSARGAGRSVRAIAEEFGVTRYQVQKILAAAKDAEQTPARTLQAV